MSASRLQFAAALALLRRDVTVFLSYRLRFVTQLLGSFFSITLFHFLSRLVHASPFASPDAYYAYAVVGLLILAVLNSTLSAPAGMMRQELVAGTFERLYVSPFGPVGGLVSMLLFPFCYALVNALVLLVFAGLVYGLPVHWATLALAIPLGALGAASFLPFGIGLLALVVVAKQAAAGTTWVVAGISLIAGLYFPISLLPASIRWLSDVQPFTPATELLRHVMIAGAPHVDVWTDLAKLVGATAVLIPLSVWILHRALDYGRRRGTLVEY
jgi:ABC-2 type transport system permease protein